MMIIITHIINIVLFEALKALVSVGDVTSSSATLQHQAGWCLTTHHTGLG